MAYFSQPKDDKGVSEPRFQEQRATTNGRAPATDSVSVLGRGMLVTGNITCAGAMQILGRVNGDIHASSLNVGEGAQVEGNVTAQQVVIHGKFKGTIHANDVKLQGTAMVDGEILNKSLTIEQNALFEGVSRRLDKAVEAPAAESARSADVVPISGAIG